MVGGFALQFALNTVVCVCVYLRGDEAGLLPLHCRLHHTRHALHMPSPACATAAPAPVCANQCFVLSVPKASDPRVAARPTVDNPFVRRLCRVLHSNAHKSTGDLLHGG